tara:strand:- start:42 stop:566 length:525 start_codon:yes stop_codon:yes gene_type:complete
MSTLKVNTIQDTSGNSKPFGIEEFDVWYMTGNKSDNSVITSNLSRSSAISGVGAASQIGTGMSESSGVFTFPSTGKYLVIANPIFQLKDYDNAGVYTQVTTNNSTYVNHALTQDGNNGSGSRAGSSTSFSFIDVTDTSNVKVRFQTDSLGTDSYLQGASSILYTHFVFVRIGDT